MEIRIAPPTRPQREFLRSRARERLFLAGVGAGKTRAGIYLALRAACRQPGVDGAWLAPTGRIIRDTMIPLWHRIVPAELYKYDRQQNDIRLVNGTTIRCRGCDQPEKRILGLNAGWVVADEVGALRHGRAIEMATERVRAGAADEQFLALLTSPHGHPWLVAWAGEIDESGKPARQVVRATTYDNPTLSAGHIRSLERAFPPGTKLHRQEMLGEFITATGLVYGDAFSRPRHLLAARYQADRPYLLGWDPGSRAAGVVVAQYHGRRLIVVAEYLPTGEATDDTARRVVSDYGHAPLAVWMDTPSRLSTTRSDIHDAAALRAIFGDRCRVRTLGGRRRSTRYRRDAVERALALGLLGVGEHLAPRSVRGDERGLVYALETMEYEREEERDERQRKTDPRKHVLDALEFLVAGELPLAYDSAVDRAGLYADAA